MRQRTPGFVWHHPLNQWVTPSVPWHFFLKQMFTQLWRLEVQDHGASRVDPGETPSAWFAESFPGGAQIRSVAQSCLTLHDPMNRSTPGLPVHHQLLEFTQTHVHRVSDAIQPSHPLSSPSPLAPSPSQHQSLFQWVNSSHEVAKVLEFQL